MLAARDSRFFMISDDDDFVSSGIVEHVSSNQNANGWKIETGYFWSEDAGFLLQTNDFANLCGTSLIVRSDLYRLPATFAEADEGFIKSMLGSHVRIGGILADRGTPLGSLPFPGAIYRVGHSGAHSKSSGLLQTYFLNRSIVRHPRQLVRNILNVRLLSGAMRRQFFGHGSDPFAAKAMQHPIEPLERREV